MKRSLDKLKGDFKHFSKSNHNKGIITGLIQKSMDSTINDLVNNTGLTKKLYIRDFHIIILIILINIYVINVVSL